MIAGYGSDTVIYLHMQNSYSFFREGGMKRWVVLMGRPEDALLRPDTRIRLNCYCCLSRSPCHDAAI